MPGADDAAIAEAMGQSSSAFIRKQYQYVYDSGRKQFAAISADSIKRLAN